MGANKVGSHYPCPCYKRDTEFLKVAELNNVGLVIYHHYTPYVGCEDCDGAETSKSRHAFIFQSTKAEKILIADCIPEIEKQQISCPRCRRLFEQAHTIMKSIPAFDKNDIIGICNHCSMKMCLKKSCCECQKVIKKFVTSKICDSAMCEYWLSKIKDLITDDTSHPLTKDNLRTSSAMHLDELCKHTVIPKHELKIKDICSDTRLIDIESTRKVTVDIKSRSKLERSKSSSLLMDLERVIGYKKSLVSKKYSGDAESKRMKEIAGTEPKDTPKLEDDVASIMTTRSKRLTEFEKFKSSTLHVSSKLKDLKNLPENIPKVRDSNVKDLNTIGHKKSDKTAEVQYTKSEIDPFSTFSKSQPSSIIPDSKKILDSKKKDKFKLVKGHTEPTKKLKGQFSYIFPKSKSRETKKRNIMEVPSLTLIRKSKEKLGHAGKKQGNEEKRHTMDFNETKNTKDQRRRQLDERKENIRDGDKAKERYEEDIVKKSPFSKDITKTKKTKLDDEKQRQNLKEVLKTRKIMDAKPANHPSTRILRDTEDKDRGLKEKNRKDLKELYKDREDKSREPKDKVEVREELKKGMKEKAGKGVKDQIDKKTKESKDLKEKLGKDGQAKSRETKEKVEVREELKKGMRENAGKEVKDQIDKKTKESKDLKEKLGKDREAKSRETKEKVEVREELKKGMRDNAGKEVNDQINKKTKESKDLKEKLGKDREAKSRETKEKVEVKKELKKGMKENAGKEVKDQIDKELTVKLGKDTKESKQNKIKELDKLSKKNKGLGKPFGKSYKPEDGTYSIDLQSQPNLTNESKQMPEKIKKSKSNKAAADDIDLLPTGKKEESMKDKKEEADKKKNNQADMAELKKLLDELIKQKEKLAKIKQEQEIEAKKAKEAAERKVNAEAETLNKKVIEVKLAAVGSPLSLSLIDVPIDDEHIHLGKTRNGIIIFGEEIFRHKPRLIETRNTQGLAPEKFQTKYDIESIGTPTKETVTIPQASNDKLQGFPKKGGKTMEIEAKGVIKYALSDRSFIEKGWTMLPTEKVVRKMNVYRMRPAHPEFNWFEHNKNKRLMQYDSGEKLAEFDDKGRGRWYYRNGRLALDYYDAEEANAKQRFVLYSSGEPDERGRTHPITILATFDYLGNGVVFDHAGKIRLKYNQTEGVVLDREIGPVSHWKWHTLNDPPVLQQVMIDTQMAHKDPRILKLGERADRKVCRDRDHDDMLAIEFDNFIKEKSKKLTRTFKPFQIKMKAMKINKHFSLRVLDQASIYLIFRDGSTNIKLNIGMILDHQEIVDTDTAEVGEVSNSLERFPARTDSLAALQRSVAYAQHYETARSERERRIRRPRTISSVDLIKSAASRPLKPPLATHSTGSLLNIDYCRCNKVNNILYYNTRLI